MKQCIICDRFLKDQKEQYNNNHYLCSSQCFIYYLQCIKWDGKKIDIDVLNDIRRETMGIDVLMQYEVDRRIDLNGCKDK
jgi:hypothetical protein